MDNNRIVRALVVDADAKSGPAHRKRLEEEGYRVVLATDPAAASLLAKKAPPSIIFINPGGQPNAASTLIEALKADTYTRHIPVRLLTHSYDQGPGKKALTDRRTQRLVRGQEGAGPLFQNSPSRRRARGAGPLFQNSPSRRDV